MTGQQDTWWESCVSSMYVTGYLVLGGMWVLRNSHLLVKEYCEAVSELDCDIHTTCTSHMYAFCAAGVTLIATEILREPR